MVETNCFVKNLDFFPCCGPELQRRHYIIAPFSTLLVFVPYSIFILRGLAKVANMLSQENGYFLLFLAVIIKVTILLHQKKSHHTRGPLGNKGLSAFHADPTPGVTFGMSTFFTQVNLSILMNIYSIRGFYVVNWKLHDVILISWSPN